MRGPRLSLFLCCRSLGPAKLRPMKASRLRPAVKPVVEVAFVLDTTGSMGPLIESAKRKIWSIATAIVDANPDGANPHGAGRLSRHRRRLRHQDIRAHHRHPGSLRQLAGAAGARRRRLAGKRQRSAACWRYKTGLDARLGDLPHHVPGRRRTAAHGLCPGREIPGGDAHGARARHRGQCRASRRRARYRTSLARDRPDWARAATSRFRKTAAIWW